MIYAVANGLNRRTVIYNSKYISNIWLRTTFLVRSLAKTIRYYLPVFLFELNKSTDPLKLLHVARTEPHTRMRVIFTCIFLGFICHITWANLIYHPISYSLATDKESYYEGEKIMFLITITNTDKVNTHPVLLPHTQNTGQKLLYLTAYDKAENTMLVRYKEHKMLDMMVHDTGSVAIRYLKPLEQVVIPIYLNDSEKYDNYRTLNASHHSFGVPLFAGIYRMNVTYNPKGIVQGDSIYTYYGDFDKRLPSTDKMLMHESGVLSQMISLKIKRSADTILSIERHKFSVKTDGTRFFYTCTNPSQITNGACDDHVTNLPPDSCSVANEIFYSHFKDLYAEGILRYTDGDIRTYRKYTDYCPGDLHTEKYDDFKQKIFEAQQLPDKRFYQVSYHQPGAKIHQETYCSADGTLCQETTYVYDSKGEFVRKETNLIQPCLEVILDGKKRSLKRGSDE